MSINKYDSVLFLVYRQTLNTHSRQSTNSNENNTVSEIHNYTDLKYKI